MAAKRGSKPTSHLAGTNAFPSYNMNDERLGMVDQYTLSHLHPPSHPTSKQITLAAEYSAAKGLPDIATSPSQGKFNALLAYTAKAKHILELGTLGGVSAIWLASINPQAKITTVEFDAYHVQVARENLRNAGVADRVQVLQGAGLEVLQRLKDEVQRDERARFGFVFIDADKTNNWPYFDMAIDMCEKGASIVVDNVVRSGRLVESAHQAGEGIKGAKDVIENTGKDKRVEAVVMQIVGEKSWDGFLLGVVL